MKITNTIVFGCDLLQDHIESEQQDIWYAQLGHNLKR